jgi:hypothetical protein
MIGAATTGGSRVVFSVNYLWVGGGCQATWVSGYVGVRPRGCQATWVSGYVGVRLRGCQATSHSHLLLFTQSLDVIHMT